MVSVVLAAQNYDKKFLSAIQNILNRSFRTVQCLGRCLDARCDAAEMLITDAESFDLVYAEAAILVFRDARELSVDFETGRPVVAIVDSCNKDMLRLVSETQYPAITCGLSPRDTVTLSSIGEDSAVIGLQRSVTCFDGNVVEPQEIPVSLSSTIDSFALMCAAAIFILTGNINRLSNVKI